MYSDQTNPGSVGLAVVCAAVCLSCGLAEVALFCFHASSASELALFLTELGAVAGLANMMMIRRRFGFTGQHKRRATVLIDAMTDGEKALLARLRFKPIVIVRDRDGWRPAGSLPRAATRVDFDAIIRDGFATVDTERNLLVAGHQKIKRAHPQPEEQPDEQPHEQRLLA